MRSLVPQYTLAGVRPAQIAKLARETALDGPLP